MFHAREIRVASFGMFFGSRFPPPQFIDNFHSGGFIQAFEWQSFSNNRNWQRLSIRKRPLLSYRGVFSKQSDGPSAERAKQT
ncbi:hypothetical protein EV128_11759 [Rhizobium azibense]|nr:hypothetical protein EV128_11759 [Rhizobium azibense]